MADERIRVGLTAEQAAARAALAIAWAYRNAYEDDALQRSWEAADERAADRWRGPESDR